MLIALILLAQAIDLLLLSYQPTPMSLPFKICVSILVPHPEWFPVTASHIALKMGTANQSGKHSRIC